jgi:hypothetical protein
MWIPIAIVAGAALIRAMADKEPPTEPAPAPVHDEPADPIAAENARLKRANERMARRLARKAPATVAVPATTPPNAE